MHTALSAALWVLSVHNMAAIILLAAAEAWGKAGGVGGSEETGIKKRRYSQRKEVKQQSIGKRRGSDMGDGGREEGMRGAQGRKTSWQKLSSCGHSSATIPLELWKLEGLINEGCRCVRKKKKMVWRQLNVKNYSKNSATTRKCLQKSPNSHLDESTGRPAAWISLLLYQACIWKLFKVLIFSMSFSRGPATLDLASIRRSQLQNQSPLWTAQIIDFSNRFIITC